MLTSFSWYLSLQSNIFVLIDSVLLSWSRRLSWISATVESFCSSSSWWFPGILIVSCWRLYGNNKLEQCLRKFLAFEQSNDAPTRNTMKLIYLSDIFWTTMILYNIIINLLYKFQSLAYFLIVASFFFLLNVNPEIWEDYFILRIN